jgi:hypothetical protein
VRHNWGGKAGEENYRRKDANSAIAPSSGTMYGAAGEAGTAPPSNVACTAEPQLRVSRLACRVSVGPMKVGRRLPLPSVGGGLKGDPSMSADDTANRPEPSTYPAGYDDPLDLPATPDSQRSASGWHRLMRRA